MLFSFVASDNAFSKAKYHDRLAAEASEGAGDQNEGSQSVDKEEGQGRERKPAVHVNMVRMMCIYWNTLKVVLLLSTS